MSTVVDINLYNQVKKEASEKFQAKTGIYRSAWIVREYKKRGGKYTGIKNKNKGLKRWFDEKWVDLTRPNQACGRKSITIKGKYPVCRPSIRITRDTPKTVSELKLSKQKLEELVKEKQKNKFNKNLKF